MYFYKTVLGELLRGKWLPTLKLAQTQTLILTGGNFPREKLSGYHTKHKYTELIYECRIMSNMNR